jgi:hypothetical protein
MTVIRREAADDTRACRIAAMRITLLALMILHLIDIAAFRGAYTAETMRLASRLAAASFVKVAP